MIVAQGDDSGKSPEMLAVEAAGGLVLPLPGGGWEVEFHLRGRDALTDDGLKTLSPLGEVFSLNLRDTRITSEGLVHIGKLTGLRKLHLERTKVEDAGLAHLSDLKELEYLKETRTGRLPERISNLREHILSSVEARNDLDSAGKSVPERVKAARKCIMEKTLSNELEDDERLCMHNDMEDLFLVVQSYSYPGDYVVDHPSVDRMAETIDKFEGNQ